MTQSTSSSFTELDGMAFYILQSFIEKGFPSSDPDTQVALAYLYANSIIKFKRQMAEHLAETPPQNEVTGNEKHICCDQPMGRLNIPMLDGKSQTLYVCEKCGKQRGE